MNIKRIGISLLISSLFFYQLFNQNRPSRPDICRRVRANTANIITTNPSGERIVTQDSAGRIQSVRNAYGEYVERYYYNNDTLSSVEIKTEKTGLWVELSRNRDLETSEDEFYWNIKINGTQIGTIAIEVIDNAFYLGTIGLEVSERGKSIAKEVIRFLVKHLRTQSEYEAINKLYTYTHRPAIFEIFMQLSANNQLRVGELEQANTFNQDDISLILHHTQENKSIELSLISLEGEKLYIKVEEEKIQNTDIAILEEVPLLCSNFSVLRETGSGKWLLFYQNQPLGIIDSLCNNIYIECELP
ncbi:MAG: GNAT family N-acetyltransferase [Candidatus Kaelpia imicola]|nr:GNAT family N-acetyltransferase [Candidatus Kaelpia imicola]